MVFRHCAAGDGRQRDPRATLQRNQNTRETLAALERGRCAIPAAGVIILLLRELSQLCNKARMLDLLHNFIVFDAAIPRKYADTINSSV